MPENQLIEWKDKWDDEYLKWICGYANAYGGILYIGIDDNGNITGVTDAKNLLKSLPDKITNTMGIIANVNLKYQDNKEYIEIIVDKYPSPISFRGKYYYRSGSTLREITGIELERILLKKQGKTWDGMPVSEKLKICDLKQETIKLFKDKAVERNRLTIEEVNIPDTVLMENLHLLDSDGYLIRAAALAFHHDPEKWITGAYIKIGCFGDDDADLIYQDEIHGPVLEQIDKTVEIVYTKYLKGLIYYSGIQRVEQYMFPKRAFREILLNAVVHKDYQSCNPIQISVYQDKIYIWNNGEFPENLRSSELLFQKHSSQPYNPNLANIFFMSGFIEAWGRGFETIKKECRDFNCEVPDFKIDSNGVMVICKPCPRYMEILNKNKTISDIQEDKPISENIPTPVNLPIDDIKLKEMLDFCKEPKTRKELQEFCDFKSFEYFRKAILQPLVSNGLLKLTNPDVPTSKNQKYYS